MSLTQETPALSMQKLDCSCDKCTQQFIPRNNPRKHMELFEGTLQMADNIAQKKIEKFRGSVIEDYEFLVNTVQAHGQSIERLWREMSPKQRKSLLREKVPLMILHDLFERRFMVEIHTSPTDGHHEAKAKYRDVMLNPCLNIENLKTDSNVLIALLKGRVEYRPEQWILYDKNNSDHYFDTGMFDFDGIHMSWLLMNGDEYGDFVRFKPSLAHSCKIIAYPRAILILEGQASMMSILRKIVEGLINQTSSLPQQDASLPLEIRDSTGTNSSAYTARYAANPEFDMQKLVSITKSMTDLSEDHICEMQTNPEYFQRYAQITRDSVPASDMETLHTILRDIDVDMRSELLWFTLNGNVQQLKELHAALPKTGAPGREHRQFSRKLREVEIFVVELREMQMERYDESRKQRLPAIKKRWEFDEDFEPLKCLINAKLYDEVTGINPLSWCLFTIDIEWKRYKVGRYSRTSNALRNLDNVIARSSSSVMKIIDENFNKKISEIAMLNEILENIGLYRFCHEEIEPIDVLRAMSGAGWKFVRQNYHVFEDFHDWIRTKGLNVPGWTFPNYCTSEQGLLLKAALSKSLPEEPKNEAWIDSDRSSRKALSAFWSKKRTQDVRNLKNWGLNEEEIRDAISRLMADGDPNYLHNLEFQWQSINDVTVAEESKMIAPKSRKGKKKKKKKKKKVNRAQSENDGSASEEQSDNQAPPASLEEPRVTEASEPLTESNTSSQVAQTGNLWDTLHNKESRKTPVQLKPQVRAKAPTTEQPPLSSAIVVSKKAYKVINTILATSSNDRTDLRWEPFCNAMQEVGLSSARTGGSMVRFEPEKDSLWAGKGSIVFHRPHISEGKISSFVAGVIGKRMVRWLGWQVGMFKFNEKK